MPQPTPILGPALRVVVKPGSKAEIIARLHRRRRMMAALLPGTGFPPHPEMDLEDHGGRIIANLSFWNIFVGGEQAWNPTDRTNIDKNLAAAMSDVNLNRVLLQYFRGANSISSRHVKSIVISQSAKTFSQTDIENLVVQLKQQNVIASTDFPNTVFNFMLPKGVVLTIDDGQGQLRDRHADVDDKSSSKEGLGGFHGSVNAHGVTLYYAVGVFSEGDNGIAVFDQPWKNVIATFYHELNEIRTDADVETNAIAWVNRDGEEIGDIPITLAGNDLASVFKEIPLATGGTAPIQLMWSNAAHAPQGPIV